MGTKFLLDLDDVLRSAGAPVIEVNGWEFRSRSSGGYDNGLPTHIMWHHTASSPRSDGLNDVNYICFNAPDKPIANLYIDRQGNVWVCAGGATNTNGKGLDTWGGGVPVNSMNKYAIGIEIANDGVGESYTYAQHSSIRKIATALSKAYNIPAHNHRAHFEWAPGRKTDPAGPPTPWANPQNRNMWDMDLFRKEVNQTLVTQPPASQGVPDVFYPINPFRNSDTRLYGGLGLDPKVDHTFELNSAVFPANITAIALNLAVIPAGIAGFLTVWPDGFNRPTASVVNYEAAGVHSGAVVVGVKSGKFKLYLSSRAHVTCDVTGYWTV
jgi:hypothetical protein